MASIHDSVLIGYYVDGRAQTVVFHTRPNKGDGGAFDVRFSGVSAYHLESDCLENIVLEILEVSAELVVGDGAAFAERNRIHGWPRGWDSARETPKQFFERQGCRCFQLRSSYGMSGWVAAQRMELLPLPVRPSDSSPGDAQTGDASSVIADDDPRNPDGLNWADLIGKYFLVGVTRKDMRDNTLALEQLHGRVTAADPERGLVLQLEGPNAGTAYSLPPDLRSVKPAPPGEYRLRSTGEVIVDPDFVATWVVTQPDS